MLDHLNPIAKGALIGLVSAILVDLHSFSKNLEEDANAVFNWRLAVTRWAIGLLTGFSGALI